MEKRHYLIRRSRREPAESSRITVITADLNREISMRSILKLVIVLVVTTGQGEIEYIYIIVIYNIYNIFTQIFLLFQYENIDKRCIL